MRPQRTSRSAGLVAVTGAAGGLGALLVQARPARRTVTLDDRTPVAPGASAHHLVDLVRDGSRVVAALEGVTTVVHLAVSHDLRQDPAARSERNVHGTAALLEAARAAGVRRVVLLTSAEVYGARPGSAVPLPADAPLSAEAEPGSLLEDHLEVERLADHAGRTGLDVVVLRPATLVGGELGPAWDGARLARLQASRLLATRGHEPLWQFCHVQDLVPALVLAANGAARGRLPVACDGWLEQSRVEEVSGRRRLELPPAVALSTAERLHRFGVVPSTRAGLADVLAPLVVETSGLRAAGWAPRWTNEDALRAHLAATPVVPSDGRSGVGTAAGATAGATVALVGTAALLRRARRRRGRR